MSGSLNRVELIGNLGRDPEVRRLNNGNAVVNFSIATRRRGRTRTPGKNNIVIFNDALCRVAEQYLKKGSKVYISGKLQTRKWQDQSGQDSYSTEVVLQAFGGELVMLGDPRGASADERYGSHVEPSGSVQSGGEFGRSSPTRRPAAGAGRYNDLDDDISLRDELEMTAPLPFRWDGESFVPINQRFAKIADAEFVVGQSYDLVVHEERSKRSHDHFFAQVTEIWQTLPDHLAARFATAEDLRKYALVQAGYCKTRHIVCASNEEAHRFMRELGGDYDFAAVNGSSVSFFIALSQSYRAMGKKDFQKSKDKVLAILADLIDVSPDVLGQNVGRAA